MRKYSLLLIFLVISITLKSQDLSFHFNLNSHLLTEYSKDLLNNNLNELKSCDSILIVGHTDTTGTQLYNDILSNKRAESVKKWLIDNSINTKINIEWKGEKQVFNPKNDSLNRRVELFAFYNTINFPKKEAQKFLIDNSKDTTLIGFEGTVIKISANSIKPKSNANKYTVVLKEYYELSDIIFDNLSTRTNSEILETGGMINIEILSENKKCSVDNKNPVQIGFPVKSERIKEMDIFNGNFNDENDVVWTQNSPIVLPSQFQSVFFVVEDMPEFQGGDVNTFQNYIQSNIRYPKVAIDSGYCGRVFVEFTIDTSGSISNAIIVRGAHSSFNAEVLRAISESPKWTPGKQRGQNVQVRFTIPITFMLDEDCNYFIDSLGRVAEFYSTVNDTTFNKSSIEQINYYIFNTLSLGWINCDWYVFKNKPKTNFKVSVKTIGEVSTIMIFSKYKVVLNGVKYNTDYTFSGVPKNEDIVVIGIKRIGDKVFYDSKSNVISEQNITLDNFEEVSFEELQVKLNDLNIEL